MTQKLKEYRKQVDDLILSIHGIDLKGAAIDEERLEDAMLQGEYPIDIAIEFDPDNMFDDE